MFIVWGIQAVVWRLSARVLMRGMQGTQGIIGLIVLLASPAIARGESIPPLALDDLVGAEIVVIGRVSNEDGKPEFVLELPIIGDAKKVPERIQAATAAKPRLFIQDGEMLGYWENDVFRGLTDATKPAIWFFALPGKGTRIARQPIELREGFEAVLAKKQPDPIFQLLQQLDFDMKRSALEALYATPAAPIVERLHEIALQTDSELNDPAIGVLAETKLLNPERFWVKWTSHPMAARLCAILSNHDAGRTMQELGAALTTEKSPAQVVSLLGAIPYDSPRKLEFALQNLPHSSELVRSRALNMIHDVFWSLNEKALTSPNAKEELAELGRRVIPLLERQLAVEKDEPCRIRLTELLARTHGVPWILDIPEDRIHDPIPPYSEEAELDFLINQLTSHGHYGFITDSAGKEIADYLFEEGFQRLKKAGTLTDIYNVDMVFDGMGYIRDPRMFDYLIQHAASIGVGERTFPATLRAIGCQNDTRSLASLKQIIETVSSGRGGEGWFGNFDSGLVDGLAAVTDAGALDYLKSLQPQITRHALVPYLRARAIHGDTWAMEELLTASRNPASRPFARYPSIPNAALASLCFVDTAESTDALKRFVEDTWPAKHPKDPFQTASLESYAGAYRRRSPLAEVSRRDPQWLASLALQNMASNSQPARAYAADIFQQLTGQRGDYRPDAFARDRAEPLKKLEAWWDQHGSESREQWLTDYFAGKGFPLRAIDKENLPILVDALSSDYFTHHLAVEQISVICGKYFTDFLRQEPYQGQKRMTVRVVGWLKARGYW